MKQKVFFLLTLLIWGGISVSAKTVNADLSKGEVKGDGATWTGNESDGYTFSWTSTDQYVSLFKAFGGKEGGELDWSNVSNFHINIEGSGAPIFTFRIITTEGASDWTPYSASEKNLALSALNTTSEKVKHITDIQLRGSDGNSAKTAVIKVCDVTISPKATLAFDADGKATIDLSKAEAYGGATCMYEAGTGLTITNDGTAGSYIEVVFDKTYDFTGILQGLVTHEGDLVESFSFSNGHAFSYSKYNPNIQTGISQGNDYTAITSFKLNLKATEGTITISDISFTATSPMKVAAGTHYTPIEDLPHYINAENGIEGATVGKAIDTYYNNTEKQEIIGDGDGTPDEYIDLDGYDELRIYTDDSKARVWYYYIESDAIKALTNLCLDNTVMWSESTHSMPFYSYNAEEGYYYAKITDIKKYLNGHAKVIGVKKSAAGKLCSKIILYKEKIDYDYIVSGQYSDAVSLDEIANSDACTIDCTGLTGADVKIGSKNPNCIIAVKKEGVVSAAKNLAVNGKIANLELTDGHSVKIPAGMTATTAKYTRTMTNTYGTIVLPFDAASDDNMEFYTISAMDANSITIEKTESLPAGTPAIIKKLVSDDITINGNGSTLNGNINNTTGAVNMFGSYTQDEKIADENAYYILDNKFWQCNEYFYCDAFRAYFTPAAGAPAANCLSLKESFGNPTLVDIVTGNTANGIQGVYNTAGVKMQGLQKGINIVRLASGETKTVIIK